MDIRISHLSDSQRSTLEMFREISNINDDYLCMQILQQNQWDLDTSLNQFVQGQSINENNMESFNDNNSDRNITRRHTSTSQSTEFSNNTSTNAIQRSNAIANSNPISSSSSSSSRNNSNTNISTTNNTTTGGLFGLLLVPLRWLFQVRPTSLNPENDTLKFIEEYNQKYSSNHTLFHPNSYQNAVTVAHQRSKFLLIYLHSPLHEETDHFCENIMKSPSIVSYLNQHMVTWVGRIWDAEAYALSSQLRVSSFPFLAVLVCQSNRTVQIADRIQGVMDEGTLLAKLQASSSSFGTVLNRNQQETQRREEAIRLRAQQDREYLESQEADRLEQERQRELIQKQQQEELEQQQAEELSVAIAMSRQLSFEDRIRKIKNDFETKPEPPIQDTVNVATIRFQLPAGKKISRRFYKYDKIQIVFDYLKLHFAMHRTDSTTNTTTTNNNDDNNIIKNFSVCTHFPKVELKDMDLTIEDVGLYPRGMLYVQDLDV